uniref:Cytochrome c oxidase subunit 2 n=1 Tax=Sinentomon erythranum TaxID=289455 RepID=G3D5N0_9HEXA|nr:cytochrome c oxidase subunit II [Sinentomon erythranum]ADN32957.1 cytochrome c oxidase subunit II [Sinentomon erythranum]
MSNWGGLGFQDGCSIFMEEMSLFHDYVMCFMFTIMFFIFYFLFFFLLSTFKVESFVENHLMEFVWTVLPVFILLFIGVPSMILLYFSDDGDFLFTIKIIGHQWYWSYEYSDLSDFFYDSYILNDSFFRLLGVDNSVLIPVNVYVRLMISSFDVIHSWALPSVGFKLDAVPGRLNMGVVNCYRLGEFYGQCSEICGANHSFMPIKLEVVSVDYFLGFL